MDMKGMDLFKSFTEGKLPPEGGYIVTAFFQEGIAYAKYEIVGYSGAGMPNLSEAGLTFQTDANKLFVLAEPAGYDRKYVEPFARDGQQQIPHRFDEVHLFTATNLSRVMFSRQPVVTYSSFFIPKPAALNFSLLFPRGPNALSEIAGFFEESLSEIAEVPRSDAAEAARRIVEMLRMFTIWPKPVEEAPAAAVVEQPPVTPAAVIPEPAPKPAPARPALPKAKPKVAVKAKKPAAKKPAVKKLAVRKPVAKKPAAKKAAAKKAAPKKAATKKKAPLKKSAAKKPASKKKR